MKECKQEEFNEIYAIMKEAFPAIERRTYEKQRELLTLAQYHLYYQKEDKIKAFISVWEYESFLFVEHLASAPAYRNQGLGGRLLKEIIDVYQTDVILEVELPQTEMAKRRIGFYQRLGFVENDFAYEQPPLQKNFPTYPLMLMSYPHKLDEERFNEIRKQLYRDVYGITNIS